MEKFVRFIGRDIYIRIPDMETLKRFKEWVEPHLEDTYFDLDQPFPDYPTIFRIPSSKRYNMNRIASQVGSALVQNGYARKPLKRGERI